VTSVNMAVDFDEENSAHSFGIM